MGNVNLQKNIERTFSGFPHRKRVNYVKNGVKCRPLCQQLKMNENENVGLRAQCVSSTNTKC